MKNKKMIFGFLAVLAIAAMAAWNVSFGAKTDMLSDVALANVEALAQESSIDLPCEPEIGSTCSFSCTMNGGSVITCEVKDHKNVN